jgi:hypothetical protein
MRWPRLYALSALIVLLAAGSAYADAFTLGEQKFYGRFGISYSLLSQYRNDDGRILNSPNDLLYQDVEEHLMVRGGVMDALDIFIDATAREQTLRQINVPNTYTSLNNGQEYRGVHDVNENSAAMGDLDLGVKGRMVGNDRAAFSAQGLVKLPYFYNVHHALPPGDGQVDIEGRLLGAVKVSLFTLGADAGFRYRAGGPADLVVYGAEAGFNYSIVYARVRLDGYVGLHNQAKNAAQHDFLHGPDYDLGDTLVTIGIQATNFLSLDLTGSYTAYGRNVANGAAYMLGINLLF